MRKVKWLKIEDLDIYISDGNYSSKYPRSSEFVSSGIPFIRANNLLNKTISPQEMYFITPEKHQTLLKGHIKTGDILITTRGDLGKTALVPESYNDANINAQLVLLRANPQQIDPKFLIWCFDTVEVKFQITQLQTGTALQQLPVGKLRKIEIPVPSLEEQGRIAEVLDRAQSLISKRREAIGQLNTLNQAIFLEMFGDPVTNPKGWPSKALTEVCYCYSGGTPSKNNDAYWEGSLPWFSAKDIKFNDLFDSQDHINEHIPAKTTLKLLPKNTVVIVVRGMILAHTFPISVLRIPATINQDLKALLPNELLEPQLLAACLRSVATFALQQVSEAAHGTKRLDAEGLRKIPIILPPLPLQQEFARRVEAVEKLKAAHRASLSELDALFASLQHRAFRGEL